MKTTKKIEMKSPKPNLLKAAPGVVFVLVILLALFLADIYMANAATEKDDHKHQENESADKKDSHGDDHEDEKNADERGEKAHGDEKHGEEEHGDEHGHEEGGHDDEKMNLSVEQQKNGGIQLAKAGPIDIQQTLPLYGVVVPNAEHIQNIKARFPGVIRNLNRKQGDKVSVGDALATIESNESMKVYTITATMNGVITDRHGVVGEQTGDEPLFVISDMTTVWVDLSVFPRDIAQLQLGQQVRVEQVQRKLSDNGQIVYISAHANPVNQATSARVLLDNSRGQWIPGHFVNAQATLGKAPVAVAVWNDALQTLEGKTVIFVQEKGGFEPRPVRLGKVDSKFSEVLEGITAGETYVARNSFILKSEMGKESAEHGH
jgi:cobalt-zinc-cadmium efflux system membrane fusion protein